VAEGKQRLDRQIDLLRAVGLSRISGPDAPALKRAAAQVAVSMESSSAF
jgi:hypothetical protein